MDLFWVRHRVAMGWNPDGTSFIQEKMYWSKVRRARKLCAESNDPDFIFSTAPYFDMQYHLEEWWAHLSKHEKQKYLLHVWKNKITSYLYGLDWWIPFFEDLGYFSDFDKEKPDEPVTLYRGIEPMYKKGMSWASDVDLAIEYQNSFHLFDTDKKLYKTIVQPNNILAIIKIYDADLQGYMDEYIVNYQALDDDQIKEV